MKVVIDFIVQYRDVILNVVLLTTSIILFILKKKPVKVVDSGKETVLKLLPGLINDVEINSDLTGEEKKKRVKANLFDLLVLLGYPKETVMLLGAFADEQIEVILSTPQKKGDHYGKR